MASADSTVTVTLGSDFFEGGQRCTTQYGAGDALWSELQPMRDRTQQINSPPARDGLFSEAVISQDLSVD